MKQNDSTYYFAMLVLFMSMFTTLQAQDLHASAKDGADDPLKKPNIWKFLKDHPSDSAMWSSYYDKPLICLNSSEQKQLRACQEELLKGLNEVVIEAQSDHVDWVAEEEDIDVAAHSDISREQEMLEQETNNYLARLEASIIEESQMVKQLKNNIAMNFFIIEELYAEEFRELGATYTEYLTEHPNEEYDKEKWIKEQEKELEKLKKKYFKEMKKQLLHNAKQHRQLIQTP